MSSPNKILFHATTRRGKDSIVSHGVSLTISEPLTDFCRDKHVFYLADTATENWEQVAAKMVEEKLAFSSTEKSGAVLKFSLNLAGLKVKTFSSDTSGGNLDEWRAYVAYCRQRVKKGDPAPVDPTNTVAGGYDVIIGLMSTVRGGKREPCVEPKIWQYALLTSKAVNALKLIDITDVEHTVSDFKSSDDK